MGERSVIPSGNKPLKLLSSVCVRPLFPEQVCVGRTVLYQFGRSSRCLYGWKFVVVRRFISASRADSCTLSPHMFCFKATARASALFTQYLHYFVRPPVSRIKFHSWSRARPPHLTNMYVYHIMYFEAYIYKYYVSLNWGSTNFELWQ